MLKIVIALIYLKANTSLKIQVIRIVNMLCLYIIKFDIT